MGVRGSAVGLLKNLYSRQQTAAEEQLDGIVPDQKGSATGLPRVTHQL